MVEGARLEIVWAGDRLGGSNPLASARSLMGRIGRWSSYLVLFEVSSFASAGWQNEGPFGLFFGLFVGVGEKAIFAGQGVFEDDLLEGP